MEVEKSLTAASPSMDDSALSRPCIILFYKYHPLSDDPSIVELYRAALEQFCVSLSLRGRILVGCSKHRSEGINGTLSGTKANLLAFVEAFCPHNKKPAAVEEDATETANAKCPATAGVKEALARFRIDCQAFYKAASCPPLEMEESEFKWSELETNTHADDNGHGMQEETKQTKTEELFPDLNIKIVNELIGTGGVLSSIQIDDLHKGYLTPQEWHERITKLQAKKGRADENKNDENDDDDDTILIDCRNTKECAIGNFVGSVDPKTTTFNQFPKWVDDHKHKLRNKNVLMYCTGGIRCEKASAYVRQAMGSSVKEVRHLQGGIHKYLEAYGGAADSIKGEGSAVTAPLWRGKNFVFDGRGAHGPGDQSAVDSNSNCNSTDASNAAAGMASTGAATKTVAVGACRYCEAPYDSFDPHCVCTVCKEPILVCPTCQQGSASQTLLPAATAYKTAHVPQHHREYHCSTHKHLEHCYFTNLQGFSSEELAQQLTELEGFAKDIAVGKKFRQRRKTLAKQRAKIEARLKEMGAGGCSSSGNDHSNTSRDGIELKCRNCGQIGCSGKCWGFHGLKRKRLLEQKDDELQQCRKETRTDTISSTKASAKNKHNERLKQQKELQKQKQIEEWIASGLTQGPTVGRDPITGLRVPKPCVRVLETTTKGKWCGRSLLQVLKTEFPNSLPARGPRQEEHSTSISAESQAENTLRTLLRKDLIRVNGNPIQSLDEANAYKLKNMDIIDRIVLWHEPPIHLPSERIQVQKIPIPEAFLPAGKAKNETDAVPFDNHIYVCNKPSTVPVHPAGPYLSNSLTMLVEAQEGLRPKTLIPCHRIDRVTSGMTICCADSRVARLIQTTMAHKAKSLGNMSHPSVSKQYLARVMGRFPAKESDDAIAALPSLSDDGIAHWEWLSNEPEQMIPCDEFNSNPTATLIKVDAPIETVDPLNGIRKITPKGKASTSLFRLLKYDADTDTSIIACVPVTGRSHQLRVHLEWIGHSIVNDVQYGGRSVEQGILKTAAIDPSTGIQRIVDNIREYKERAETASTGFSSSSITQEQAQAAREVCPTCDLNTEGRGPSLTFSPAQLLQGGHAICLHAYQYNLAFFPEEKLKHAINKNKEDMNPAEGSKEKLFGVDLKVDLPPWASHLQCTFTT